MQTHDEVLTWMASQTWPDLRDDVVEAYPVSAYLHPYGFIVVRLSVTHFPQWGIRAHVWPGLNEYDEHGVQSRTTDQRIHCHGWDLISRTLLGQVKQRIYTIEPSGPGEGSYCSYRVISDIGVGESVLRTLGEWFRPTLDAEEVKRVGDEPLVIARGAFHETVPVDATHRSLTLAATAHVVAGYESVVLMPPGAPEIVRNRRLQAPDVETVVLAMDEAYDETRGIADGWASFVFLTDGPRVFMVRTYRNPGLWQPIGGQATGQDDDPLSTLIREVREEVGINLDPQELYALGRRPRDKGVGEVHAWHASADGRELRILNSELREACWIDIDQALSLPTFPATRRFLESLAGRSKS